MRASATSGKARLNVLADGRGAIDMDMVSLYPKNTWKNRPNGLRSDLVQLLRDMKPGFLRFPGGCIVEGKIPRTTLSMENNHRRSGRTKPDRQPLERRVQASPNARLLSIIRSRLLRVFSTKRRHRRRAAADS
ncbi:MAG: hypothetical protein WKF84_23160 [Pyrinomonadaceae bacterium]